MLDLNPFEIMGVPSARPPAPSNGKRTDLEMSSTAVESLRRSELDPQHNSRQERAMKKVLQSIDILPLGLLYNAGPRARPDEHHDFRWLPLHPSKDQLDVESTMAWTDDGLRVESSRSKSLQLFRLDPSILDAAEVVLTTRIDDQVRAQWKVRFLRHSDDKMVRSNFTYAAVLFDTSDLVRYELRGACFLVPNTFQNCSCPIDEDESYIRHSGECPVARYPPRYPRVECIYDCPARGSFVRGHDTELCNGPIVHCWHLSDWNLVLKCGRFLRASNVTDFGVLTWGQTQEVEPSNCSDVQCSPSAPSSFSICFLYYLRLSCWSGLFWLLL